MADAYVLPLTLQQSVEQRCFIKCQVLTKTGHNKYCDIITESIYIQKTSQPLHMRAGEMNESGELNKSVIMYHQMKML